MNYYERHLGDYARDAGHLTMLEHGAYTLLLDRYYTTEQGIPADQAHRICRARTRDEKAAVDAVLGEFFKLVDGLWTNGRAERELAEYRATEPDREAKKANNRERQERSRERRRAMFETLRGHGVVPAYDAPMSELQAELSRIEKQQRNAPVTRYGTGTQSPDTSNQETPSTDGEFSEDRAPAASVPPARPDLDELPAPSLAGRACMAMRGANVHDVNPAHPDLLALLAAGVTPEEIGATAAECAAKGRGRFAYVLATVKRRRAEAAASPVASLPAASPMAWADSRGRVVDMGNRLGIGPFEEVDRSTGRPNSWPAYRGRVIAAWQQSQGVAA